MAKKYKVVYDREACIGAAACVAVAPEFWEMADDGMADLISSNKKGKVWELVVDEKDVELHREAAESCPVDAIKVVEVKDSEE